MRFLNRPATRFFGLVLIIAAIALSAVLSGCSGSGSSEVSSLAPDFSGVTLDGTQVSLADYLGKPLVLNFMASWCGPCKEEAPDLDQFYRDNKDRVAVLAIDVSDTEEDIRALMSDNGWTFPVMLNGDEASFAYNVSAIPATFVIDSGGHITKRIVGATTAAELSLLIDGLTR